eukprot:scaffold14378_cov187-Ochromonas_danica.AAC.8
MLMNDPISTYAHLARDFVLSALAGHISKFGAHRRSFCAVRFRLPYAPSSKSFNFTQNEQWATETALALAHCSPPPPTPSQSIHHSRC